MKSDTEGGRGWGGGGGGGEGGEMYTYSYATRIPQVLHFVNSCFVWFC